MAATAALDDKDDAMKQKLAEMDKKCEENKSDEVKDENDGK